MGEVLIRAESLCRTYRTWQRGTGLGSVLKGLVHREYREVHAVRDLDFAIRAGELVGFLGPNGAGKSTTIKMLCGILHPTSGCVEVGGLIPWKHRKRHVERIGAVFGQKSQLVWDIPPLDSFHMNRAIYGIPRQEFQATLDELAGMLEVEEHMQRPTRSLSLGERMKCEFLMAMLHRPGIVLLDEPTIGLDVVARQAIRDFVRRKNREGTTFLLTTHDLADVESLAERVMVINHGTKVFDGSMTALKEYSGRRRLIRLESRGDAPVITLPGLKETGRTGTRQVTWELDTDTTSLEAFLATLGGGAGIQDLQVEEVPIESIIKDIYHA